MHVCPMTFLAKQQPLLLPTQFLIFVVKLQPSCSIWKKGAKTKKSINNQTKTSNQKLKIKKNLNPDLSCSRELSSTRDSIFSSSVSSSCFSRRFSASCCSRWRFSFSALLLIEDLKGWSELTSSEDWDSVLRDLWRLQAMHSINNSQNS